MTQIQSDRSGVCSGAGRAEPWEVERASGRWNTWRRRHSTSSQTRFLFFPSRRKKKFSEHQVELILKSTQEGSRLNLKKGSIVELFRSVTRKWLFYKDCCEKMLWLKAEQKRSQGFSPWWRYLRFTPHRLQQEIRGSIVTAERSLELSPSAQLAPINDT